MIYKIFNKIYRFFYFNYNKGKVSYTNPNAKNSFVVETGSHIDNPNVTVGENVKLFYNVMIFGDGPVYIGDGTLIGFNTIIYSSKNGGVHIGKNCAIAANSYIIDTNHSTNVFVDSIQSSDESEKVVIGDNVWISAHCIIGKGSRLSDNVVVGANSFVNKAFPKNSVIAGTPAKIIKYRGE